MDYGSKPLWALALLLWGGCETTRTAPPEPATPPPRPPAEQVAPIVRRPDEPVVVAPAVRSSCGLPVRTNPAIRTLVYARPHGRNLRLDLATPAGDGPHPWVAVLHGGGWSGGERAHVIDELQHLASLGYAAAAIDYRLVDQGGRHRFPTQVADVRCAIRALRRRAPELGLDPERAAALGYSAGAHLALMLATAPDVAGLDECEDLETSPHVRLAIAYYAPVDLRASSEYDRTAERIIDRMLGASRRREPERAALASPVTHVGGRDAAVMLVHGTADRVVPYAQSRLMRAALARAGVPVQLVEVEGAGHGFRLFGRDARTRAASCTSLAFLEAALRTRRDASRSEGAAGSPP